MENINLSELRESDLNSTFHETDEEYVSYRRKSLPEGYTAYRETPQVESNVYDRYDSVYLATEKPNIRKKSCYKIGWLSNESNFKKISFFYHL